MSLNVKDVHQATGALQRAGQYVHDEVGNSFRTNGDGLVANVGNIASLSSGSVTVGGNALATVAASGSYASLSNTPNLATPTLISATTGSATTKGSATLQGVRMGIVGNTGSNDETPGNIPGVDVSTCSTGNPPGASTDHGCTEPNTLQYGGRVVPWDTGPAAPQ